MNAASSDQEQGPRRVLGRAEVHAPEQISGVVSDGRERVGHPAPVRPGKLLADRKDEAPNRHLDPAQVSRRAGGSGDHRGEAGDALAPRERPPVRRHLDHGGDGQQHAEGSAEPGEKGGTNGEPVSALSKPQEGDERRQEQEGLRRIP